MSLNAILAIYIQDIRDKYDVGSNSYKAYNKAYRNMCEYRTDIYSVEQALHVPWVGKNIVRMLTNRLEKERVSGAGAIPVPSGPVAKSFVPPEALLNNPFFDPSMLNIAGLDAPGPSTSRGRGGGRARGTTTSTRGAGRGRGKRARADEDDMIDVHEGSPTKKRSPTKNKAGARSVMGYDPDSWAVPDLVAGNSAPPQGVAFNEQHFWYLDTEHNRVSHYSDAEIHIVAPFVLRKVELPIAPSHPPPFPAPFKLIYLEGQPLWTKTGSRVAWLDEDRILERKWERCAGFLDALRYPQAPDPWAPAAAVQPPRDGPQSAPIPDNLADLLAHEPRSTVWTVDPSRTDRARTAPNPRPISRTPSSSSIEILGDSASARRAAADAAVKRQQAAQTAQCEASALVPIVKGKEKAPARTVSAPTPIATPSATALPQLDSAAFFPSRRLSTTTTFFPTFQPIIFPPCTYNIILILDNREIGRHGNREALKVGLEKLGVPVEQRSLAVGDALWVARSNVSGKECVLDWIVERKRLDDLCASIKDSRFQDQKYRLSQSGLQHVFYLVEDFASNRLRQAHELMINTALSRTQVVDEFHVKETRSQQETIEFLGHMHSAIQTILEGQTLHILPSSAISRPTYMDFQAHLRESEPDVNYLVSWSDFQNLNGKNATRTVGETWARMLLCIKGLSAERTSKLLEHYSTAREMWEAYEQAELREMDILTQTEATAPTGRGKGKKKAGGPKTMLAELGGEGRRKIGPALSETIWEVMMSRNYRR